MDFPFDVFHEHRYFIWNQQYGVLHCFAHWLDCESFIKKFHISGDKMKDTGFQLYERTGTQYEEVSWP